MVGVPAGAAGGGVGVGLGVGVAGDVIGGGEGEDLRRAAAQGDTKKLLALLEEGFNVNQSDECGYTALQRAACEGHMDTVRQLIKHNANVDHQDDQHGNTALHEAAWKGYSQTAEVLVRSKANVYIKNKGGFAPLHLACQNGHNQTCRVLLLAGCKPDIKNNYGDTPLHTAARYGHAGVTRILISARSNVGEMNKNGDTALHIAAAMGRRKLTKILLESSADQTVKNKQQETPGDIARRKEFNQILEILKNPPPVVSVEERLRLEQEQKKREAKEAKAKADGKNGKGGKGEKKREKTNDSGTSSKDSSTKAKEKKKHKSDHKEKKKGKHVDWSPYGCQYYPPIAAQDFVSPNIDSLPKDPLSKGEQYFIDLAGNIKKGPVGVGYTCYCAPFFKNVESKLEKDKVALMDHIDAAHDKLDAKITNLEHRTRSHIQHLSDTVKQKLAAEKEECRQRSERVRVSRETEAESRSEQLKLWVERRLAIQNEQPHLTRTLAVRGSVRRIRDSVNGMFPLTRSRSEEAISEYRDEGESDQEPVYKGLRVLDHPTSMYNIPQNLHDEADTVIYDSPKPVPSLVPGTFRCPSPDDHRSRRLSPERYALTHRPAGVQSRSHSLDAREVLDDHHQSPSVEKRPFQGKPKGESPTWMPPNRDLLNESTSSDASAGQRGSRSSRGLSVSSIQGSPLSNRGNRYSPAHPSPLVMYPDNTSGGTDGDIPRPSPLNQTDLNQAVDNLRVSQSEAENGAIPKIYRQPEDQSHDGVNGTTTQPPPQPERSGYSRYDYRNTNPYMYGDLRGRNINIRPQPITRVPSDLKISKSDYETYPKFPTPPEEGQTAEPYQAQTENIQEEFDASTYLDMDRYRIQQAVRRLYDGYLAEGHLEAVRGIGRTNLESSLDHDSHNDSGYSTRLCTGSQGPSPALSGGHEIQSDTEMKQVGAPSSEMSKYTYNDYSRHSNDYSKQPAEQEPSRHSITDARDSCQQTGPEGSQPTAPHSVSRYNNGLPQAVQRFSTPHLGSDTIIIGESSLV